MLSLSKLFSCYCHDAIQSSDAVAQATKDYNGRMNRLIMNKNRRRWSLFPLAAPIPKPKIPNNPINFPNSDSFLADQNSVLHAPASKICAVRIYIFIFLMVFSAKRLFPQKESITLEPRSFPTEQQKKMTSLINGKVVLVFGGKYTVVCHYYSPS